MNKFSHNQEIRTKLYKRERYSEFEMPQSGRKFAIAQRVAGISTSNVVASRSCNVATIAISSSRLVGRGNTVATWTKNILI